MMLSNYWVLASLLLITVLLVRKHVLQPFKLFHKSAPIHSINNPAIKLGSMTGVHSIQGCRSHMEDAYFADWTTGFFAVFDGHGGHRASQFASRYLHELFMKHLSNDSKTDQAKKVHHKSPNTAMINQSAHHQSTLLSPGDALEHSFLELDRLWLDSAASNSWDDGSTCVAVYIHDGVLYVANVGDSRAVLVSSSGVGIDLSSDHKPSRDDEKKRIESLGGRIIHYGTWRVEGVLAVTRAIGDRKLKRYVTAMPELKIRNLTSQDAYLILASDGVWDVLTSQQAAQIVQQSENVKQAAINLTQAAYQRQSQDNITSIVIDLKHWR